MLAAVAGRHDREAAKARVRTVWLRGVLRSDFEEAMAEAARADAAIQRISGDLGLEGALFTQVKTTSEGRNDPWFGEIAMETDVWLAATT